jgi:hypothetical protein
MNKQSEKKTQRQRLLQHLVQPLLVKYRLIMVHTEDTMQRLQPSSRMEDYKLWFQIAGE